MYTSRSKVVNDMIPLIGNIQLEVKGHVDLMPLVGNFAKLQ